jgi:CubicO group peptidase (beta-lactamase class C family)
MPTDIERPAATRLVVDAAYWRSRLAQLIDEHGVPGAALGILRDGQIIDVAAGVLNRRTQVAATPDSVFNLGSITKVWTATMIMQLVDEGALTLDTPVVRALPEFAATDADTDAAATAAITVRHLLSHTSGIDDMYAETGRGDDCVARYVAKLRDLPQVRPVGATFSYCNAGIVVAGRIIETITGKTWDAALRERLVGPLGLTATVTLPEEALLHRVAVGHPGGAGAPPTRVWSGPRSLAPTGRITARVHDLLAFVRMHLAGGLAPDGTRLLSAESAEAMTAKEADLPCPSIMGDSWGLGWSRDTWDGQLVIGHSGVGIGQLAFVRALPGREFAVALLTNGGDGPALYHDVFAETFRELAGVAMPAPFQPPAEPARVDIAPYEGRYYARSDTAVELVRRDGAAVLRLLVTGLLRDRFPAAAGEFPLVPIAEGRFAMRTDDSGTWEIVQAHRLPDGTPYLYSHWGLVANPRVGAPAGG